jgi:hypothetical protein
LARPKNCRRQQAGDPDSENGKGVASKTDPDHLTGAGVPVYLGQDIAEDVADWKYQYACRYDNAKDIDNFYRCMTDVRKLFTRCNRL